MKKNKTFLFSLIAVFIGILVGVVILIATGKNPLLLFVALIRSTTGYYIINGTFSFRYIGEFFVSAIPLILTGLSVGFAFRTGMFNIGAEGQVMVGSLAATFVALCVPVPDGIKWLVCLIAAAVAGALWAAVPGILKAKFKIHEVVICIMMNYIALYFTNWAVETIDPMAIGVRRTADFSKGSTLMSDFLRGITGNSRLHWGIFIAIAGVIIYWLIIEKTTFGFNLRATGFNSEGAKYAGMKVNKNIVLSMMISGAFAGLAGACITQGVFGYGRVLAAMENYGFDGIAVALVGNSSAIGILLSGLLFAMLQNSQNTLQILGLTKDIVAIIMATVVLAVAMKYGIEYVMNLIEKKNEREGKKPKLSKRRGE
ncbi:MAG: ABC transporter permease [Erysipelotrichaceae bacterium]